MGRDGTIWFTDSSARFGLEDYRADIFEHSGTGRLLRRDPDGATHTLVTGLQFANGVALAADEACVFYAETGGYRVNRLSRRSTAPPPPLVIMHFRYAPLR